MAYIWLGMDKKTSPFDVRGYDKKRPPCLCVHGPTERRPRGANTFPFSRKNYTRNMSRYGTICSGFLSNSKLYIAYTTLHTCVL